MHLGDAYDEPGPAITPIVGRHLEVERLVAEVGNRLAQIPGQTGCAQQRAGHAQGEAALDANPTDVLEPIHPDRLPSQELLDAVQFLARLDQPVPDLRRGGIRQVLSHPTGTDVRMIHPQSGNELEYVET